MRTTTARLRTIALLIALLVVIPFVDVPASRVLHGLGEGGVDGFLAFVCSWPFITILFLAPLFWIRTEKRTGYVKSLIAVIFAYLVTFVLKELFEVSRPFDAAGWIPLESHRDYGFPSSHAATVFALLPMVAAHGSRLQTKFWLAFSLFIALSRVVLGMHFPSDVLSGGLLGFALGHIALRFDHITAWRTLRGDAREIGRQLVHMAFGVTLVVLIRSTVIAPWMLLLLAAIGGILSLLHVRFGIRPFARIISVLERPSDRASFPGRGILFYLLGSWIVLTVFPLGVASAAILILAFGDGTASLLGKSLGSTPIAYNAHKSWEGTFGGIVMATIAAGFFFPWWIAFVSSLMAMLLETFPLRIKGRPLDDNLILPFVAATVIVLVSPLFAWISA